MTRGAQELWWESPGGEWFWQASDGKWYPGDSHPNGVPESLARAGSRPRARTAIVDQVATPVESTPVSSDPWEVARKSGVATVVAPTRPAAGSGGVDGSGTGGAFRPPIAARVVGVARRLSGLVVSGTGWEVGDGEVTARRRRVFLAALGGVVLVGLALRLGYVEFAHPGIPLGYRNGDAVYYQLEGASIQHGLGYANPTQYLKNLAVGHFIEPDAEYAPMTALVLSGADVLGFTTYFSHQILWCLLGTLTVILLALAAREIAGDAVGIVTGMVAALYPGLWINDGMVESETLLELAVSLLLYLCFRFWKKPTVWLAVCVGAAAGLAAMSRAEALLFVPLLVIPLTLTARETGNANRRRKRRLLYSAVSCGVCLTVMSPWVVRNFLVFDSPVLALDEGQTLGGANDTLTYYGGDIGGWDITSVITRPAPLGDPSDQDAALRHIAIQFARSHLNRVPLVVGARFARVWGLMPTTILGADVYEARQRWASTWGIVMFYLMLVPSIVTIAELRWWRITVLPLVAPLLVATITAVVFYGDERLRADAEPALVLAATITATSWSDLPTMFRNVRRGLTPRWLLGMGRETVPPIDGGTDGGSLEKAGGFSSATGANTAVAGLPWGGLPGAGTGLEILPVRPGHEPSYRMRRVGGIGLVTVAAAVAFMASISFIDATGKADFAPRSGFHMAQLLLSEQMTDQVTLIQYQTPGHFNPYVGDGTLYVTTGSPKTTYVVRTKTGWTCSPFTPDLVSNISVTWPGEAKPLRKAVANLEPLSFTPVPPISCLAG